MTDGWGFLAYVAIIPAIFGGIISLLIFAFFMKFPSFRNFLISHYFWLAWLFPYYLLLIILGSTHIKKLERWFKIQ